MNMNIPQEPNLEEGKKPEVLGEPYNEKAAPHESAESIEAQQLEKSIAGCKDWDQLIEVIRNSKGIKGSQMFYSPQVLIDCIEYVRSGGNATTVTNTFKLRDKAINLRELDLARKELNLQDEADKKTWLEDWDSGKRPEGYVKTEERYLALRKKGYRSTKTLGPVFVQRYNQLLTIATTVGLSKREVEQLLECNRRFNTSMDRFEEDQKSPRETTA